MTARYVRPMNTTRFAFVAVLLSLAAVACGDSKPAVDPQSPGPTNSANLPGGPVNTGGAPSLPDAGK